MKNNFLKEKPFYLDNDAIRWVDETLNAMTENDLIEQVFCSEIRSGDQGDIENITIEHHLGAVMCLPNNAKDMYELIEQLQTKSKIPMLIAGNLEEGADAIHGATNIANNLQIGATGDVRYAGKMGRITGIEASTVGINWAFAPVIDIAMNWRNSVVATRVFSADAGVVAQAGKSFMENIQAQGVAAAIKHFPGDGVDERDQHFLPSINSLSCEEWNQTYGAAYVESIEAGVLTVMVGHILQPAWTKKINSNIEDADMLPASTSKELLQGLLRKELGFNGMISTDATTMAGFDQMLSRRIAIPTAIAAGCDMLLFSKNLDEDISYLKEGLQSGIVTIERLKEAVTRILGVKAVLGLHKNIKDNSYHIPVNKLETVLHSDEARKLELQCANKAITLVKEEKGLLPIDVKKYRKIYLYTYAEGRGFGSTTAQMDDYLSEKLSQLGFEVICHNKERENQAESSKLEQIRSKSDLIIYAANLNAVGGMPVCRIDWGANMRSTAPDDLNDIPTIFISFANPYHLMDAPRIKTYINAYKFKDSTVDAVLEKLIGKSTFEGKSPVDPFCGLWDAKV